MIRKTLRSVCSHSTLIQKLALIAATAVAIAGCRLYEPQRYERLKSAEGTNAIRVLMIGDSLTYYNDLPGLLQQFSARESTPIYIEKITFPLAPLSQHWNTNTRNTIKDGHWTYVVLQDFSRKPVTDPEDCIKYYDLFNKEVTNAGAKSIVFENWTRKGMDNEFDALNSTYSRILQSTHGIPAPLGAAFKLARSQRPDIKLLLDDRHPSDAGSYLAAAVFYDVIYHKRSSDLPYDLEGPKLSRENMGALRTIADRAAAAVQGPY